MSEPQKLIMGPHATPVPPLADSPVESKTVSRFFGVPISNPFARALIPVGDTLEKALGQVAESVNNSVKKRAPILGIGSDAVAGKIIESFGTGEVLVSNLIALQTELKIRREEREGQLEQATSKTKQKKLKQKKLTIPGLPRLEDRCSTLLKYTLPTQTPKVQLRAFQRVVELTALFPGLRLLFLRSECIRSCAVTPAHSEFKESICKLWDHPDGPSEAEWTFCRSFAAVCLSETEVSTRLERFYIRQLNDEPIQVVIEELLKTHKSCDNAMDDLAALCIRYLREIITSDEFWGPLKRTAAQPSLALHTVLDKLCLAMVRLLQDIELSETGPAPFDYEGVDSFGNAILTGVSNLGIKELDDDDYYVGIWSRNFRETVQRLRKWWCEEFLQDSFRHAKSEAYEILVPPVLKDGEVVVEEASEADVPAPDHTVAEPANAKIENADVKLDSFMAIGTRIGDLPGALESGLGGDMPPLPPILYGREALVADIGALLADPSTSRVCITGIGGIGKTSVALAVFETATVVELFPKEYRFWVPCVKAKSAALLRRILYTQLRVPASSFETPLFLDAISHAQVIDILSRLVALPHVALLVTMTSGFPPSDAAWQTRQVPPLNPVAARETFKAIYPDAAVEKLDELLEAVGHVPLAITLMAADGKHLKVSPEELLEEWKQTSGLASNVDRIIGMSMNREVTRKNPQVFALLAVIAMLPAGTSGNNLRWWAPYSSLPTDIRTLRTAGLIEQDGGTLFASSRFSIRPTIQAYMSYHNSIPAEIQQQVHEASYKFVLAHKSTPDDATFKDDLAALAEEEINIEGILMQIEAHDLRPNALDALIAFSLYQFRTKPSTVVAVHALHVALAVGDDWRLAEGHECLGNNFMILDHYEDASQHFEEARRRFKALSQHHRAGESAMQLADAWIRMGRSASQIGSLVLEAQADLSHNASDRFHVARGLLGLGQFLWYTSQFDEAFAKLSTARAIFEELNNSPASTAECLYHMASIHGHRKQYTEALEILREALSNAKPTGDATLIWRILISMASWLIRLSLYDEASSLLKRSLSVAQTLGRHLMIAQSLERLGYNSAASMDLPAARAAYEGAQHHFANLEYTAIGVRGKARSSYNHKKLGAMTDIDQTSLAQLSFFEM
ncbi:hypothetical protein FB451DRAFT_1455156 [Mycena latifolia]|nr:hypothetical protein FB451DRAFT_1455156 [Mycena latifolia]